MLRIYLQVHEVVREIVEDIEAGPEQKWCSDKLDKLSSLSLLSNSEYHIFFFEDFFLLYLTSTFAMYAI